MKEDLKNKISQKVSSSEKTENKDTKYFEVNTKHTKKMLRDFLSFQDAVKGKKIYRNMIVLVVCSIVMGFLAWGQKVAFVFLGIGAFFAFLIVFRYFKTFARLANADPNYQKQTPIKMIFKSKEMEVFRGESIKEIVPYKSVYAIYRDKEYLYMSIDNEDLHMFRFDEISGDRDAFINFIAKKTNKKIKMFKLDLKAKKIILKGAWDENQQARRDIANQRRQKKLEKKTKIDR